MCFHIRTRIFLSSVIFVLLFSWSLIAAADCTNAKVRRLARQGNTITSIAGTCNMDMEEVEEIIDAESVSGPSPDGKNQKFAPGTPVGQCGCWGYVQPSFLQPHNQCQSGYARPSACNSFCPTGGYMWQGVCT